jgi:mRNA interferase MazF
MTTEPGEVYLVDLGMAAKSRPMLVVSRRDDDPPRALAVCAPITTSSRGSNYEVGIGKPRFLRERSYVNVQGLQAIQFHEMKEMIGKVPEDVLSRVRKALDWMFEISHTKRRER